MMSECQIHQLEEPSGGQRAEQTTELKPPGGLDFDSTDLSHTLKRQSEEIQLHMDLAMEGRHKKVKVKMLLYYFTLLGESVEKYIKPITLRRTDMIENGKML